MENLIIERILQLRVVGGHQNIDVKETAQQVLYDLRNRKGINIKAVFQHMRAVAISGSRYEQLKKIKIPTLIIHGTDDKMLPWEHGKKLLELIPGATSLWLEGVGHVFPLPNMNQVLDRVIEHIDAV